MFIDELVRDVLPSCFLARTSGSRELFGRTRQGSETRSHTPGLADHNRLHPTAGKPDLIDDGADQDGPDGELDARVFAPFYSSEGRGAGSIRVQLRGSSCHASR